MKALRVASFLASLGALTTAWADVRYITPAQTLTRPATPTFEYFGMDVAIDGGYIIVIAGNAEYQAALLYRRSVSTGQFVYRRTLQSRSGTSMVGEVAMKNGIAAIRFGNLVTIYENAAGDYVPGRSAAPLQHPGGVAISGNSVLIGSDGCDYDGVVYQKGSDGNWSITGRLDDNQGECHPEGLNVDLNYDHALLTANFDGFAQAWRRNGTSLNWVPAGTLNLPPGFGSGDQAYVLSRSTAVGPFARVFRRDGTTWTETSQVTPVDDDNDRFGSNGYNAVFRDGVLVLLERARSVFPYVYLETTPGHFEHIAVLASGNDAFAHDVSGRSVVVATRYSRDPVQDVVVLNLPAQLRPAPPIVNDFETRDISGFTFIGGQFALARRGTNDVLTQGYANGLAVALVDDTDWNDFQRIDAEITTLPSGNSWVGVVAKYVDADNYYFAAVRSNFYELYKRVNGVNTLLAEGAWSGAIPKRVGISVDHNHVIVVWIDGSYNGGVTDKSLSHGRAGLATSFARADFDDVHVTATDRWTLLEKDWSNFGTSYGRELTPVGGTWQDFEDEEGGSEGWSQVDTTGDAFGIIGQPVANQEITSRLRLGSFNSAQTSSWFGLVARYVDSRNFYAVAIRSNGQAQIRKRVNGVTTVLDAASFTAVTWPWREFRFRVINDQLQLFLDGTLIASAHDGDIARGQYGLATHYASAVWNTLLVQQP